MKKNLFMVAAVALIATVSCSKEELGNSVTQAPASDVVFVAEFEQEDANVAPAPAGVQTKTALGTTTDGITAVNWLGNEVVNINGVEFTTTSEGPRAKFTTTEQFDKNAAKFDAIYPSTAGTSLDAVTIPASQKGTFADAAISVATSTTYSLNFKNLASMLKFQVPVNAQKITIEAATTNLAGKCHVTFDTNGNPVIGEVSGGSKIITLEGEFKTGTDYYVAVIPGNHKLTVKIDDFTSYASTKTPMFERSVIKTVGVLPELDLLYLVPNSNWKADNARFAAYFYNDKEDYLWVDLKEYNGFYACDKKSNYSYVIFCRMNGNVTENRWNNDNDTDANKPVYNQTADMKVGTDRYCIIPFDVWSGCNVWSKTSTFDSTGRYYLYPSTNWKEASARFAVYFFNSSTNTWVSMTKFSSDPEYYEVVKPAGNWTNMIFCRFKSSSTNGWNGDMWGQTADLGLNDGNFYTVVNWNDTGSGWSTKK